MKIKTDNKDCSYGCRGHYWSSGELKYNGAGEREMI
jgi:hypothetical protein